ncbi:Flp family type IVb pilin [Vibrio europaeus]|uniref:Flp family type IVb pilin n=1 Tax=Vibrio europaeus TaxID=300876 RepID=UPI00234250DC|nr:Flp family type IVb pilin [Vibrio europaeus]MDC5839076.1 Flp family type IVb pilin [Vibrio europaeus]
MKKLLNDFIKNEDGVTAIEYAVIGVAMAVVLGTVFAGTGSDTIRGKLDLAFKKIRDNIITQ